MPITLRDQTYYRTAEVCEITGLSRTTLWRWMKKGILEDSAKKDRRGWRLFTDEDIRKIEDEAYKLN